MSQDHEQLREITRAMLDAIHAIRAYVVGPPAPDEEVRSWPLWAEDDGVWCGDEDCPLEAESSEIGDFREGTFTLAELHEAIGEHIARRREREADDAEVAP